MPAEDFNACPLIEKAIDNGDVKALAQALAEAEPEQRRQGLRIWGGALGAPRQAEQVNVHMIELLLGAGAEVDARDETGWTPLMSALNMGLTSSVQRLLQAGADANAEDDEQWSCVAIALRAHWEVAAKRVVECLDLLVAHGADLHRQLAVSAVYGDNDHEMHNTYAPESYNLTDFVTSQVQADPARAPLLQWLASQNLQRKAKISL